MNEMSAVPAHHKFDADTYYAMAEAGLLKPTDRVELIGGEIVDMAPIGQEHMGDVNWLTEAFVLAVRGAAIVSIQNSVRLGQYDVPEPDVVLFKRRDDFYRTGARPTPADVLLIVEVADSSLATDRSIKMALYAKFGITEYWILDVKRRRMIVHRQPEAARYAQVSEHTPDDTLALAAAPAISIALSQLL